jgi:hypothetical protein
MKRILAIAVLVLVSGCFPPQPVFVWSNEYGRQCFYQCKRDFFACRTSCFGYNANCAASCADMEFTCDRSCPGLRMMVRQ